MAFGSSRPISAQNDPAHGPTGDFARSDGEGDSLSKLHDRIRGMLADRQRSAQDPAVVLRLDPLLLAAAQAMNSG